MVYGIGMGVESSGQDVEIIKLYGARLDGSTGLITNTIECYLDRLGHKGCANHVTLSSSAASRYREYVGNSNKPLVGFGFGVQGNVVNAVWAKQKSLSFSSSGNCSN